MVKIKYNNYGYKELPLDWNVSKIKYCFALDVGLSITKENLCANGVKCINYGYIHRKGTFHLDLQKDILPFAPIEYLQTNVKSLVKTGDFVFCDTSEDIEGSGNFICVLNDCNEELFAGSHTIACKKIGDFNSNFLAYFCATDLWKSQIQSKVSGTKVYSITQKILKECLVFFPPLEMQQRIVDFLDTKCAHIDDTIAKEKELIEKLKEYRQSVITEAITKGLNPSAPMKNSGIDWIGEIPKSWSAVKIKTFLTLRDEKNYKELKDVCLLSLYTEFGVFPHGERAEKGNKAINADGYKVVYKNDIVVNIILAWMGAIAMSDYDGVTSPAYDVYAPDVNKVVPQFYHYLFRTKAFSGECYKYGRGIMAMRWRTYSTEFKNIFVPFPSYEEQQNIVSFINEKISVVDNAINQKEQLIEKLNQYKKSLIYEAVTGKVEV